MAIVLATSAPAIAQHTHNPEPASPQHQHAPEPSDTLFPAREASGTSWLPDATPMYAVHRNWRGWSVMLHGNLFAQFLYEPGERHRTDGFSTHQFSSTN